MMKNIHILPTDKPSRLHLGNSGLVLCDLIFNSNTINAQHIYITSDEEIKEGDWFIRDGSIHKCFRVHKTDIEFLTSIDSVYCGSNTFWSKEFCKKIILTTDQDLIGVQAIDNEFLEWFVKNPSCESVEVGYGWIRLTETDNEGYWISIPDKQFEMQQKEPKYPIGGYAPGYYGCTCVTCKTQFQGDKRAVQCEPCAISMTKEEQKQHLIDIMRGDEELGLYEEPKQETLEEAAERLAYDSTEENKGFPSMKRFIEGAKWQQEQDNKELGMWKLAVEKQEARCKALNSIISTLQERSYSEKDMINFAFDTYCYISELMKVPFNQISENKLHAMYNFEQFKKK